MRDVVEGEGARIRLGSTEGCGGEMDGELLHW